MNHFFHDGIPFYYLKDIFLNTGKITSWNRQNKKINANESKFLVIIRYLLDKTILESMSSLITYSVFFTS